MWHVWRRGRAGEPGRGRPWWRSPPGRGGVLRRPQHPRVDRRRGGTIRDDPHAAAGQSRWTPDEAKRRTGRQVAKTATPQKKISAIHTLAKDEEVAATRGSTTNPPCRRSV
ncbi:DUF6192 family protein [Streptomyces coeruleorubidus]